MERATQYITDSAGNRVAVILDIETYQQMLEALDDADAIRSYDAAVAAQVNDELVPLDQAVAEIEGVWTEADKPRD